MRAHFETEVVDIGEGDVTLRGPAGLLGKIANDSLIVQVGGTPPAKLLGSLGIALITKYGER